MDEATIIYLETDIKNYKNDKEFDDFMMAIANEMDLAVEEITEVEERQRKAFDLRGNNIKKYTTFSGFAPEIAFYEQVYNSGELVNSVQLPNGLGRELWDQTGELLQRLEIITYREIDTGFTFFTQVFLDGDPILRRNAKYSIVVKMPTDTKDKHAWHRMKNRFLQHFDTTIWHILEI